MPDNAERSDLDDIADSFDKNGFAVAPALITTEEVARLRLAYDEMVSGGDLPQELDRKLGGITKQIMLCHLYHKAFAENEAIAQAGKIAARIMGTDEPKFLFSMIIYKPPGHPHPTPWHQDMSYAEVPFAPAGYVTPNKSIIQFWLALDDVDETMGCMEFIPGMQDKPMPEHYVASGDEDDSARLLAIRNPERDLDLDRAIPCPLKAGSSTLHGYATPHFTGPNRSKDKGRLAFIFSFTDAARYAEFFRSLSDGDHADDVKRHLS